MTYLGLRHLLFLLVAFAKASVRLKCNTTVDVDDGIIEVDLWPGTAAHGVRRIIDMAEDEFFSDLPFYNVLHNMVTFGLQPNAAKQLEWNSKGDIPDDPMPPSNPFAEGLLCFSGDSGKRDDSRSTILFFTIGSEAKYLMANRKTPWEVPVGKVIRGLNVIKNIYAGERGAWPLESIFACIRLCGRGMPARAYPRHCCQTASTVACDSRVGVSPRSRTGHRLR
jgi:cyclophilin family peptidyl-prolyl cis-trans isomerase